MRMTSHNVDNVNMTNGNPSFERPYHHGNLRTALIEAGLLALEQTDASELSLRAIARDIGVSANAAYRHFADKQALLSALAAEGFRRFSAAQQAAQQAVNQQASADATMTGSMATGRAYIAFAQAHPALFRLMFGHLFSEQRDPDLLAASMSAFEELVSASAQDMRVDPGDDRALVTAIARWSLVHGLSHLLLDGQLAMFGDRVDQLVNSVMSIQQAICPPNPLSQPTPPAAPVPSIKRKRAARP